MRKEIILFSLWGIWVIHCQMLCIALLTAIMPQGSWWEIAFFLLSLFIFGLNIGLNYVWAVFVWFKSEDYMNEDILGIVLLAILTFVAIPLGSQLHTYFYFATTKVQNIATCPNETQQNGIFQLQKAQLLHALSTEMVFKHLSKAKGQSATSYAVNYKLTPLACGDETDNQYRYFVVANQKEKVIWNFDLEYVAIFAKYSRYKHKYQYMLPYWAKKYKKNEVKNPIFLELIDLKAVIADKKYYFWLLYGIVNGIWISFRLILPFGVYLKNKYFNI